MPEFTVSRFGKHPDGYFHAKVSVGDKSFYVHRRFGSWLAPGEINGKAVLKEINYEIKQALQQKARAYEKTERNAPNPTDTGPVPGSKDHA